jgi:hypothetical protein
MPPPVSHQLSSGYSGHAARNTHGYKWTVRWRKSFVTTRHRWSGLQRHGTTMLHLSDPTNDIRPNLAETCAKVSNYSRINALVQWGAHTNSARSLLYIRRNLACREGGSVELGLGPRKGSRADLCGVSAMDFARHVQRWRNQVDLSHCLWAWSCCSDHVPKLLLGCYRIVLQASVVGWPRSFGPAICFLAK